MPPFAFVELQRCLVDCLSVAFQATDEQGRFSFTNIPGQILPPATYQLFVSAGPTYQPVSTPSFVVTEGQHYDAGDIALALVPVIGSISGRVVDAATGAPLPGTVPPFAFVELQRCLDFGCFDVITQPTDNQGRFLFQTDFSGGPLPAGTYQLLITAAQYRQRTTAPFTVGESENVDLGDIGLTPPPLQFSEIRPCGQLPPEGGECAYSFRITNTQTSTLSGLAWTIVEASSSAALTDTVRFQPGLPMWYLVQPGASQVVRFAFTVPSSTPNGSMICVQGSASQGDTFFNVIGQRTLFCITKGFTGFRLLSENETRSMRQSRVAPHTSAAPRR
jgi:hypothetical protein